MGALRILVTGASGFIGSAFIKAALRHGHVVAGLTRGGSLPAAIPLHGSLADPPWSTIRSFKPDVCVHCAWVTAPGIYLESPENQQFHDWSLEFLAKLSAERIERALVLGTCAEYAPNQPLPLNEHTSVVAPSSTYARLKHSLHTVLRQDTRFAGLKLAWGRVFYPYGPGEHPKRLPSLIASQMRAGETMNLRTPHAVKDYIFIDDLASAMLAVIESKFTGTVNLGSGAGISVLDLALQIQSLSGRSGLISSTPHPEPDPLGDLVAEMNQLASLGWTPKVPIAEGLSRLIVAQRSEARGSAKSR